VNALYAKIGISLGAHVRVRALQLFYAAIATCRDFTDHFNVATSLRCTYSKRTVANLETLLLECEDGTNLRASVGLRFTIILSF
jgi:hypothetical protein